MKQSNPRLPPDVNITQSFEDKSPSNGRMMDFKINGINEIEDSVMISQPDMDSARADSQQNNSVSSTINMMHNINGNAIQVANRQDDKRKGGPSSVRISETSIADKFNSNESEYSQTQQSARGSVRQKSPRKRGEKEKRDGVKRRPAHLEVVFKAISERPILDNMTREERIREKLKFFNLENESLETSRKRIQNKVSSTATRFGPRKSNMRQNKDSIGDDKNKFFNPFEEMMAIEAEFGSIFASQESLRLEEAKNASKWFPLFETISQKRKNETFSKIVDEAQKHKQDGLQQKQLALIKQQIARGVKNVNTAMLGGKDGEDGKMDVSKMIADEQRRAQNHRMEEIVSGIKMLSEKSFYDASHFEGIKDYIGYKYPIPPCTDQSGQSRYNEVLSKVNSQWDDGELSEMKIRTHSRQGSPNRTFQGGKWRKDSINIQDFKQGSLRLTTGVMSGDSEMTGHHHNKTVGILSTTGSTRNKTIDRYGNGQGQGQGGQNELVGIVGTKSVQPGIFDRIHTQRNMAKDGTQNNFDLFSKANSRESFERVGAIIRKRPSPLTTRRISPSPINFLHQDDSFYLSTQEQGSPFIREMGQKPRLVIQQILQAPITDSQWKEHQVIKQVLGVDDLNTYAGELATEMRIYSVNRLENIRDNVNAIIKRLRQIKPKKRFNKKSTMAGKKIKQLEAVKSEEIQHEDMEQKAEASDSNNGDVIGPNESPTPQIIDVQEIKEVTEDAVDPSPAKNEADDVEESQQLILDETEQKDEIDVIPDETASPEDIKSNVTASAVSETPVSPKQADEATTIEQDTILREKEEVAEQNETEFPDSETFANKPEAAIIEVKEGKQNLDISVTDEPISTTVQCEEPVNSSSLIMKTVNDREFDVSLILKFNKNDYKKTKICRESLKSIIQALEQNDLVNFDFDWAQCFKHSIFQEELSNEIVPLILVLKKFTRTNIGNRSLRSVLARKLVNFKILFGIIDPEEMPVEQEEDPADYKSQSNNDLVEHNLQQQREIEGEGIVTHDSSQAYQDSLYRGCDTAGQPIQNGNNTEEVYSPTSDKRGPNNPFSKQGQLPNNVHMNNISGSASTFNDYQIAFIPMMFPKNGGIQEQPLHPQTIPNRIATASQGKRKFAPKNSIQKQELINKDALPKLTGNLGMASNSNETGTEVVIPPELQAKISNAQRLIKTSHLKQRSKMAVGEIDDGSQLRIMNQDSSCISPKLPSAEQKGLLKSTGTAQRNRHKNVRKQALGTRKQYVVNTHLTTTMEVKDRNEVATNNAWPSLHQRNKSYVVPGSLYTTSGLVQTAPQTPNHNSLRSGSTKQSILVTNQKQHSQSVNKRKSHKSRKSTVGGTGSITKTGGNSPQRQRQTDNKVVEHILARRILMQSERRQPAPRTRTTSSHQAMINAMGYRSFGSSGQTHNFVKKLHLSSVLPNDCALKALRANNSIMSPCAMSPTAGPPYQTNNGTALSSVFSDEKRTPTPGKKFAAARQVD